MSTLSGESFHGVVWGFRNRDSRFWVLGFWIQGFRYLQIGFNDVGSGTWDCVGASLREGRQP